MLLLISITRERFLVKKLKNKIPSIFFFYTSSDTGIFRFLFDRIFPSAKKFLLFFTSKFFLIASHDCVLSSFFNFSARKYSYGKYNTQYESILHSISIVKSKQNSLVTILQRYKHSPLVSISKRICYCRVDSTIISRVLARLSGTVSCHETRGTVRLLINGRKTVGGREKRRKEEATTIRRMRDGNRWSNRQENR